MKSEFRDWSDVRVFLEVVRDGSTPAASKRLWIAKPSAARRIEALGLVLFDRGTLGFKPTPEAQALIEHALPVDRAVTDSSERAGQLIAGRSCTIRITAFKQAFSDRLPVALEAFIRKTPMSGSIFFQAMGPSTSGLERPTSRSGLAGGLTIHR